ncbi:MAG: hypothetical protein KBT67_07775 [bacterium]|nr:hypothetical protein [Candidatus Limimorpha caballi]
MKKCWFVAMLCAGVFFGCRSLGISMLGVRQHYDDLSKEEQSLVVWTQPEEIMGHVANDGRIYAITGGQLRMMIEESPRALLYTWDPVCKSEKCVSLEYLQRLCNEQSVELYVVVDYFFGAFSQNAELTDHPLFVKNSEVYGTDRCEPLSKMFLVDLLGEHIYNENAETIWYRYMYFEDGKFVKTIREPSVDVQ